MGLRVKDSNEPMVSAIFSGRLGNILLEITNAFIYAKELGIDSSNVYFHKWYAASNGIAYTDELKALPPRNDYLKENKDIFVPMQANLVWGEDWKFVKQHAQMSPYGCSRDVFLRRAWPGLLSSLFYDEAVFSSHRARFPQYFENPSKTIAMHIRRTDYSVFRSGRWLLTREQIQGEVNQHVGKMVVIFSDDIEWCKKRVAAPKDGSVVFHPTIEVPSCTDMILMSNFKMIVPNDNSSYSLFAKALSADLQRTGRMKW